MRIVKEFEQNSSKVVVAQCPPQLRTIKVLRYPTTKPYYQPYYLRFPYMQFIWHKGYLQAGARHRFSADFYHEVYLPPLTNVYAGSGFVCQARSSSIEEAIGIFWQSPFNPFDLDWIGSIIIETYLKGYESWEQKSREDPNFLPMVTWPHPIYLEQFLGKIKDR